MVDCGEGRWFAVVGEYRWVTCDHCSRVANSRYVRDPRDSDGMSELSWWCDECHAARLG